MAGEMSVYTDGTTPAIRVGTQIQSIFAVSVMIFCLTRRVQNVVNWRAMTVPSILVLIIYVDSLFFVISTMILEKGWSLDESYTICNSAIMLCLFAYFSTKVGLYLFFAEKCRLVRHPMKPRLKDGLYLFNVLGVVGAYGILVVFNIIGRISYINSDGHCIIGMKRRVLIPLDAVDALVNLWLTFLFLQAVRNLHSFKQGTKNVIRTMAVRTLIGCFGSLMATIANMTLMLVLNGERGWLCLMTCTTDATISVAVLHWVSSIDKQRNGSSNSNHNHEGSVSLRSAHHTSRPQNTSNVSDVSFDMHKEPTMKTKDVFGNDNTATLHTEIGTFDNSFADVTNVKYPHGKVTVLDAKEKKMFGGSIDVRTEIRQQSSAGHSMSPFPTVVSSASRGGGPESPRTSSTVEVLHDKSTYTLEEDEVESEEEELRERRQEV